MVRSSVLIYQFASELVDIPAVGVFLCSKSARYGSVDLFSSLLAVFTAASALPFDCALYGELVEWLYSHLILKLSNSREVNCGPLSVCTISGIPNLTNDRLQMSITDSDDRFSNFSKSMKSVR